jgi:secreted PhoX family phosphatase
MPFARNALSQTEMGGLCFSPDGGTLFANIQEEGLTLAIEGPFAEIDVALARAPRRKPHAGFATLARAAYQARRIG